MRHSDIWVLIAMDKAKAHPELADLVAECACRRAAMRAAEATGEPDLTNLGWAAMRPALIGPDGLAYGTARLRKRPRNMALFPIDSF